MRSELFHNVEAQVEAGTFARQNTKMLKVRLAAGPGFFYAVQGSMVAYQGAVDFGYEGSGGVNKLLKKALTGEGMSLMKVSGSGDVFLARDADDVFVLELEGDAVTVNGWDIRRVEGASMLSGGLFNTTFSGTGALAITVHGTPVVLNVDQPTFADMQSAVCWSASLQTGIRRTATAGALVGRGSGEAYQLALTGQGFVVVQASEGHPVAGSR
ncbi:MAG: AIM24 family protein [Candidatus Nanopelagicales bacterium]|nr:AIM24 family protein [Candidatus Nanopelagicales bacterium]